MTYLKLMLPVLVLLVAGCASKDGTSTDSAGSSTGSTDTDSASTYGSDGDSDSSATPIGDDRDTVVMNDRVVYFAFDSTDIDDVSIALLRQHGRYLADNPGEKARLEGHTDERGSREYNIGLGERRSVSVQSVLLSNGASASQLVTISYGEERPAAVGSDEETWAQNRRVEIVYER
jgi:peptidoglycan-associated lipoprotein